MPAKPIEPASLLALPLTRRGVMGVGLGTLALLAAGSLLPAGCRRYPRAIGGLRHLDAKEYAIVTALANRLLELDDDEAGERIDVALRIDAAMSAWEPATRRQLRTILRVFEHGTHLFDLRRRRFTLLTPSQQRQSLDGWMNSSLGARRVVFRALKALVMQGYYQDDAAWAAVGYDGPWLGRIAAQNRIDPLAPVAWSEVQPQ
jgi:hypothetical protein